MIGMNVRLLHRTTRSVSLTEAGEQRAERLAPALAEVRASLDVVNHFRDRPAGTLRLNVPANVARTVLPPIITPFLKRYPEIRLEVTVEDSFVDLMAAGCDAGIRCDERLAQDMIAMPIGPRTQRLVTAAAPAYLEAHGRPNTRATCCNTPASADSSPAAIKPHVDFECPASVTPAGFETNQEKPVLFVDRTTGVPAYMKSLMPARWAPLPLRLIVGYGFMEHGFAKIMRGPDIFAAILQTLGVPAPHLMAWATILVEVFGGLAILLGAFVTLASLPMAVVLLVAMFTVHLPYGFSSIKLLAVTAAGAQFGPPGYECDLLYLACLAALVLGGAGPLAIDGLIRRRLNTPDHPSQTRA